jgi:hypothetical protein
MSIPEPLRQRVDDVLWVELGRIADERSSHPAATTDAIDALEHIGLLEPADAEMWRGRFAEATTPPDPMELTAEVRERLHTYLTTVMAEESRDVGAAVLSDMNEFRLLDPAEVSAWYKLLPPAEDRNVRLVQLERTVIGPAGRRRGARIVTVDLFDHGVAVRMHWARPGRDDTDRFPPLPDELEPGARPVSPLDRLRLQDDVGTVYRVLGGGGSGGGGPLNWDAPATYVRVDVFAPHVPEAARQLVVRIGESTFEIAL